MTNLSVPSMNRAQGHRIRGTCSGLARRVSTVLRGLALCLLVTTMVPAGSLTASACGWWGDGESDEGEAIVIGPDGLPVSPLVTPAMPIWNNDDDTPSSKAMEVPAPRSGYGILVRSDGSAVPYLEAIPGQNVYSIQQLRNAGFLSVIDLGTPQSVAVLHRQETETLGMQYFNIPLTDDVPGKEHVTRFGNILSIQENLPILVFSASADMLAGLWVLHRLNEGESMEVVLNEGRAFGLSENAIQNLIKEP